MLDDVDDTDDDDEALDDEIELTELDELDVAGVPESLLSPPHAESVNAVEIASPMMASLRYCTVTPPW
ncbi:MAG: hypothetical protein QM803_07490 [Rhodocyclaceae bacterium]